MTTTAVFSEVLAVRLQAVVLVSLALLAFVDVGVVTSALAGWEALGTILVVALAYVLGVIVDRLADSLLGRRLRATRPDPVAANRERRRILEAGGPLSSFLEYQRSRMRLMRGTLLNVLIAMPVTAAFLWSRGIEPLPLALLAVVTVGPAAVAINVFSYRPIAASHDAWLLPSAEGPVTAGSEPG